MEIQREKDRVVELTNDNKKYKSLKKVVRLGHYQCIISHKYYCHLYSQEHAELQEKYAALQETVAEQEIAMVEMGRQLSL